jgi:hypothetical protein
MTACYDKTRRNGALAPPERFSSRKLSKLPVWSGAGKFSVSFHVRSVSELNGLLEFSTLLSKNVQRGMLFFDIINS